MIKKACLVYALTFRPENDVRECTRDTSGDLNGGP